MSWQLALTLLLIINPLSTVLIKLVSDRVSQKAIAIFYQSFFCVGIATLYAFFGKKIEVNLTLIAIGIMGFFSLFGTYCQWRAFELSLSKTTLFYPLMGVVTIFFSVIFLGESALWNFQLGLGILLYGLAIWFFQSSPPLHQKNNPETINKKWVFFTMGMILIFGIVTFLMQLFSSTVSRETFLLGWYSGAFLGSLLILGLTNQNPIRISWEKIFLVLPLSFSIIGSLLVLYWTFQLGGPASLILPVVMMVNVIIPILLGWFIFKERKGLSKKEVLAFLIGIAGTFSIIFS